MIEITALQDPALDALPPRLALAARKTVATLHDVYGPNYDPQEHGSVLVLDETDTPESVRQALRCDLERAAFDGVVWDEECRTWMAVLLRHNEGGPSIVVPDEPWLPLAWRRKMLDEQS